MTVRQMVYGKLIQEGERAALWLARNASPLGSVTPEQFYLRYALTIRGPESLMFPAIALDDWGNRVRKLKLYDWVRENGDYQPRSEVFGSLPDGSKTQFFLRELELHYKYPTFVYTDKEAPLDEGIRLDTLVILSDLAETVEQIKAPAQIGSPLSRASVNWWHAPTSAIAGLSLDQLIPKSG